MKNEWKMKERTKEKWKNEGKLFLKKIVERERKENGIESSPKLAKILIHRQLIFFVGHDNSIDDDDLYLY